jgi:copper chaperone CopZ
MNPPLETQHVTRPIIYIDLGVGGMTCDDCVVHVTEALESVPGVERATVDLESRRAVVEANGEVSAAALAAAVRATGQYNAFERGRRPASDA